jgi:hypothetical protein
MRGGEEGAGTERRAMETYKGERNDGLETSGHLGE